MLNCEGCSIPATGGVPANREETAVNQVPLFPMLDEQTKILAEIGTMLFSIQDRLTGRQEKRDNIEPPHHDGLMDAVRENRWGMLSILQTVNEIRELIG